MTKAIKTGLYGILLTGVVLTASFTVAHASTPAPAAPKTEAILSAVDAPLSGIVVMGKRARRATDEVLRLDTRSASSCAFSPGSNQSMYLEGLAHIGVRPSSLGSGFGYFSESSPYGDASTYFDRRASVGGFGRGGFGGSNIYTADGCSLSDYSFAAGRARIARRDKTLPQAYALYDAQQYDAAMAMFEQSFRKLPGFSSDEAALMIGRIYIERAANPADAALSLRWLERAAGGYYSSYAFRSFDPKNPYDQLGPQAEAAAILGKIYLVGYGVPRDPAKAAKWFKRAFDHGHVPAAKILGDLYASGYGVRQDKAQAISYYRKAAYYGFSPAQYKLGQAYYYGEDGVKADVKTAIGWYQKAASSDQADALYALAYAYDSGEGVARDAQKAVGFYKTAALNGSTEAQTSLGIYFYKGELVPADQVTARTWFEAAAIGGDADAMYNLAAMMARGEGGDKDMVKALAWMNLAKAGGHTRADQGLAALEGRMTVADRRAADKLVRPRND